MASGVRTRMRPNQLEWLLRTVVFGFALVPGIVGSWSIWEFAHDYGRLFLFIFAFVVLYASMIYIVKKRKLKMLQA
jgi:hypothetical protein